MSVLYPPSAAEEFSEEEGSDGSYISSDDRYQKHTVDALALTPRRRLR